MKKDAASLFLMLYHFKKNKYKYFEIEEYTYLDSSKIKVLLDIINSFLMDYSIDRIKIDEDEIIVHDNFYDNSTLERFYNLNFYEYQLDAEERKKLIFTTLIVDSNTKTMEYFAQLLNVSRMTIVRDIKDLEKELQIFKDIEFESLRGIGIRIIGDEIARRKHLTDLILEDLVDLEYLSYFSYQMLSIIQFDLSFKEVVSIVSGEVDVSYNFSVPVVFFVVISRRSYEQSIEYNDSYSYEYESFEKSDLSIEFDQIFNAIISRVDFHYTNKEKQGIFSFYTAYRDKERNKTDLYNIILAFLKDVDKEMRIQLSSDFLLIQDLYNHLKMIKTSQVVMLNFENSKEFKHKYSNIIHSIDNNIEIIEKYTGYKHRDSLILSVSIHVVAAYIRKFTNITKCNSLLVVDVPKSTARIWEFEINQINGIRVKSILSKFEYEKFRLQEDIDMVISNEPLSSKDDNVKYCVIKKMGNFEKAKIKNLASDIIYSKNDLNNNKLIGYPTLSEYLNLNAIRIIKDGLSWKEAIYEAGKVLLDRGYIEETFITHAIHNVDKYGPYIVLKNGVALAHANCTGNVYKNAVSFLKFDKPVRFANDSNFDVHYLFFVAFSSTENYPELLKEILDISENSEKLDKLKKCKNTHDIYDTIMRER